MKVQQLKQNSLIKLEFSGSFYKRLQDLTIYYTQLKNPEELKEIYRKISDKEELNEHESNLETLLILIGSLEDAAKEQNLIEEVELPTTL